MKKISFLFIVTLFFISCKDEVKKTDTLELTENYSSFGDSITSDNVLTKEDLLAKYETMKDGDTVAVKFKTKIKEVCSKKGCWMNVDLSNDKNVFVRFKDYGFFMPLNSAGSEAIINGKAYMSIETVADLQHFAKDAGKSQAAIDSITEPKITYAFMSDGVLIKK